MKNLKNVSVSALLLILFLCPTVGVSQRVVIDSINQTTLLDKKATIAQGNIVKRYDSLEPIHKETVRLKDSLWLQTTFHKSEIKDLRLVVIPALEQQVVEVGVELKSNKIEFKAKEEGYEAEIKTQKIKKWIWGTAGAVIAFLATMLSSL